MDKLKVETTEINDIEISQEGKFNASTGNVSITEKTHDNFIKNFKDGIASPYLNLDHDDKMTDKVKKALKVLRLGTVKELVKKGKSLYASFSGVPIKIADLIKSGMMSQRSMEYSKKFKTASQVYDDVLLAVSMFGVAQPAIPGLEDYVEIFSQQKGDNEVISILTNKTNKEVGNMEIEKKEYEELIKIKAEHEITKIQLKASDSAMTKLQAETEKKSEEVDKKAEEVEKKEKEVEKKEKEVGEKEEAIEKDKEENLKKEAGEYVNTIIGEGKIIPKFKEKYIDDYVRCASGEKSEEAMKLFKEDLESRGKVVKLSNYKDLRSEEGDEEEGEKEVDTNDPEAVDEHLQKLDEKITKQIKKLKANGVDGDLYKKARAIVVGE